MRAGRAARRLTILPSAQNRLPFLVAGGGIGGLTCALALAKAGFPVEVFEQTENISEIGAGLQLSPNATRILSQLGILDLLDTTVGRPEALCIYSALSESHLTQMPLGHAAEKRWGAPYYVARRADLQQALLDACRLQPNIAMHFSCTATGYTLNGNAGLAVTQAGAARNYTGCAIIGADGIWSKIRAQFLNDGAPRASGFTAYRALIPVEMLPPELSGTFSALWMGPVLHVVHYPLRGNTMINIVAVLKETCDGQDWGADTKPDNLFAATKNCATLLKNLLHAPQDWTRFALYHRPADCKPWPHLPVTLLGDAAHPMLPFLAQGAAQAIEDAAMLAACVTEHQDIAAAFAAYRTKRARRIARLTKEAERNGRIFHLDGLQAKARNFALHLMGGERLMRRYDWVYSEP